MDRIWGLSRLCLCVLMAILGTSCSVFKSGAGQYEIKDHYLVMVRTVPVYPEELFGLPLSEITSSNIFIGSRDNNWLHERRERLLVFSTSNIMQADSIRRWFSSTGNIISVKIIHDEKVIY